MKIDTDYPKDFIKYIQTIFKRLFRIYAHIYYSHFDKIVSIQAEAHLNTCFKHFYFFSNEFNLIRIFILNVIYINSGERTRTIERFN